MSIKTFSETTKKELCETMESIDCCRYAEYAGMLLYGAVISGGNIRFITENKDVLNNYMRLCGELGVKTAIPRDRENSARYTAQSGEISDISRVLADLELTDSSTGVIRYRISSDAVERDCCMRAFIRGAFLSGGTVIDPRKNYNLEFVTPYLGLSRDMQELLRRAGFEFKSVVRKSKYVLYLKNSESISDFLTYMGAFKAQMELLNIKIEKEIRNDFNRAANSETANLEKTINASVEQVKAIEKIKDTVGLDNLPDDLRDIAILRLEHKELSLSELAALTNPPLSKSGVNHRLKRLMKLI